MQHPLRKSRDTRTARAQAVSERVSLSTSLPGNHRSSSTVLTGAPPQQKWSNSSDLCSVQRSEAPTDAPPSANNWRTSCRPSCDSPGDATRCRVLPTSSRMARTRASANSRSSPHGVVRAARCQSVRATTNTYSACSTPRMFRSLPRHGEKATVSGRPNSTSGIRRSTSDSCRCIVSWTSASVTRSILARVPWSGTERNTEKGRSGLL